MVVVALATALTGAAIIAPSASAATGCVTRTFGESNTYQQCVRDEQVMLNDLRYAHVGGPNQLLTVDGYYGAHTFSDVKSFQTVYSLRVDGITGPQTWRELCLIDSDNDFVGAYWHDAGCATII
jgi:zinc D-Ala-D-Ala carboxypeptidase